MASIDYNDARFTNLEQEKQNALSQSNSTYDSLINQSGQYYDNLINQSKDWADKQADIQNQQTDFAIQKIEQQKEQAVKDYTKEQKGAYQDYMKQSNAYGSNMQTMGQKGLSGSGWSETIQSGFYNTYQNRYAQARETYNEVIQNYNNNISEAQLQNSSALAQIYAQAQQQQLELALQNFTVIKDLTLNKQNAYVALDSEYNNRWRQIEQQINTENSLAEQIRQYNESLAEQKRQADMDNAYRLQQLALSREQLQEQQNGYTLSNGGSENYNLTSQSANNKASSAASSVANSVKSALSSVFGKSSNTNSVISPYSSLGNSPFRVDARLSNGKNGYLSAITAYKANGGTSPYNESTLLKKGIVKKVSYKGKTYYYV